MVENQQVLLEAIFDQKYAIMVNILLFHYSYMVSHEKKRFLFFFSFWSTHFNCSFIIDSRHEFTILHLIQDDNHNTTSDNVIR